MSAPAAVVPIKSFDAAKSRLAPALDRPARALLARTMAEQVLGALEDMSVFVATDDERVAAWAIARDARVVWSAGMDLDASVGAGIAAASSSGAARVVVAHADLPFAQSMTDVAHFPGATLVPDRHGDGTNVVSVPVALGLTPMYGPGSFVRHLAQLRSRGAAVRVLRRADLQWDVDVPEDLPEGALLSVATAR